MMKTIGLGLFISLLLAGCFNGQNTHVRLGDVSLGQQLIDLKRALDAEDKAEMLVTIEAYRVGQVPLVVPLTLLKHHFRRHPDPYVQDQYYLEPHPKELMLRNVL